MSPLSCVDKRKWQKREQLLIESDADTVTSLQYFSMELRECQS